ncbi:MAG: TPM domain-containing protein [Kofleriaceae bacterium]
MLLLLATLVLTNVVAITDVPNPRSSNRWVSDTANIIDADVEAKIESIAQSLFDTRTVELAVVTVDDTRDTPKAFATGLFNHWGIGSAQTNNGVLVLMVMSKRRLEIETGTGIEAALPPDWLSEMQARDMVPAFKTRDFGGGLLAGVAAISVRIGAAPGESTSTAAPGEYRSNGRVVDPDSPSQPAHPGTTTTSSQPRASYQPAEEGTSAVPFALGGLGVLAAGGTALAVRQRRRNRICLTCSPPRVMLPLDEIADDAHLDEGQRAEERIESVNYEVLVCPGCQASRTLRHAKWFSGHSKCPKCSYKTLSSTSSTIVHATYDHGGQVRVDDRCKNCSYSHSYTKHTARRTRPSTSTSSSSSSRSSYSSSSRSSSFGGGRSRGGGSGSSW